MNLLGRLEEIKNRWEELGQEIMDPAAMSDMKRYAKLNKEYSNLRKIVDVYHEYRDLLSNIETNKRIIAEEKDEEFRGMAKGELAGLEEKLAPMEEDIKMILIPPDPMDNRNAVIEIRAGTGGDEASLFAGDLLNMYLRYCAKKGWKASVVSESEGTVGGYKEVVVEVQGDRKSVV